MAHQLSAPPVVGLPISRETYRVSTKSLLISVLNWLRAGYPEGVPGTDRVPLLALLRATPLTEEQVAEVVRNIAEAAAPADVDDPIERDEIAEFIAEVTDHDAGPENIARVAAKLAAAGWPLAGVELQSDAGQDSEAG
ncbi:Protein of unknown function [Mycobacterium sp. 88mf]|nr:Protein of unknown function [Mycobacterium sp. 88mf]SFF36331.1 Protein of unknown function [Mycobacterium sp. 455mf]